MNAEVFVSHVDVIVRELFGRPAHEHGDTLDVGAGVTIHRHTCSHSAGQWSGAIVAFHDQDPPCEGAISWCKQCHGNSWELVSLEPLTLNPSIACQTHPHHHGYVREGRWSQA